MLEKVLFIFQCHACLASRDMGHTPGQDFIRHIGRSPILGEENEQRNKSRTQQCFYYMRHVYIRIRHTEGNKKQDKM